MSWFTNMSATLFCRVLEQDKCAPACSFICLLYCDNKTKQKDAEKRAIGIREKARANETQNAQTGMRKQNANKSELSENSDWEREREGEKASWVLKYACLYFKGLHVCCEICKYFLYYERIHSIRLFRYENVLQTIGLNCS